MLKVCALIVASVLGQVQPADSVIQVDNKVAAIKVLRESNIRAVELKSMPFVIPNVKIDGLDTKIGFGDMVVLSANVDRSQFSDSLAQVKYQWVVLETVSDPSGSAKLTKKKNIVVWPDGSKIFFSAGKEGQEYTVILDIDCLFLAKDGEVIKEADVNSPDLLIAQVKVGGDTPTPPGPGPGPGPQPPDPSFPPGKFGLSEFGYKALKDDPNLSGAEKVAIGGKLAEKFEGVASQIGALPELKDLKAILALTSEQLSAGFSEIGINIGKTQLLKTKLSDKVFELYKSKNINTAEDVQVAWRELALGLKSYK